MKKNALANVKDQLASSLFLDRKTVDRPLFYLAYKGFKQTIPTFNMEIRFKYINKQKKLR